MRDKEDIFVEKRRSSSWVYILNKYSLIDGDKSLCQVGMCFQKACSFVCILYKEMGQKSRKLNRSLCFGNIFC